MKKFLKAFEHAFPFSKPAEQDAWVTMPLRFVFTQFRFSSNRGNALSLCFTQFRTENRYALFLELL
ncbi:hypothetical protein FP026_17635 [Rhizobium tropici]|uniref:Uncharacterized protein n=1 Tax=Rhizobium tropici TaxID=398 RepID=A0A5B0VXI7_RHITR|nr:hypothetical protein FP026_17635 [Rhizobium tropici]